MGPGDLASLEKIVGEAIKELRAPRDKAFNDSSNQSTYTKIADTSTNPAESLPQIPVGSEWKLIQAYQIVAAEDDIRKEREANLRKKLQFRQSLDQHIRLLEQQRSVSNSDDVEYSQHVNKDVEHFIQEEKQKFSKIKAGHLEEKAIREMQINELNERKKKDKEDRRREEEYNIKLALDSLETEKQRQHATKLEEKRKITKYLD